MKKRFLLLALASFLLACSDRNNYPGATFNLDGGTIQIPSSDCQLLMSNGSTSSTYSFDLTIPLSGTASVNLSSIHELEKDVLYDESDVKLIVYNYPVAFFFANSTSASVSPDANFKIVDIDLSGNKFHADFDFTLILTDSIPPDTLSLKDGTININ